MVTRRAVARMATVACIATVVQLVAAPIYALNTYKNRPSYDVYAPLSELAGEVTRAWHERFNSPFPIVVSTFEIAAPVAFYSADHPRMFADSPDSPRVFAMQQPEFSPWIDYPSDLRRYGFVGICADGDTACRDQLRKLDPAAQIVDLTLAREIAGVKAQPWTFHLAIARPNPPLMTVRDIVSAGHATGACCVTEAPRMTIPANAR
jgi:hypothetical protein